MAESELSRVEQKIFGRDGASGKFGQIGSKAAGSPVYTKDLDTIQSLEQFLAGWSELTDDASEPPRMEDMNSLDYLITSQLAYIFQMGIPEWVDSETARYYANKSICRRDGSVYLAIQGDDSSNINAEKDPATETEWWKIIIDKDITITSGGTMGDSSTIVPTEDRIAAFLSDPSFIKWTSPQLVGTGLSISGAGTPALVALNSTDVAFIDDTLGELRTYRWDGSTWSLVGTGLSISGIGAPALAALNGTDVAFIDATIEELRTYRWDDSTETWSLVGTGLSISGAGTPALVALNSTDVAFIDETIEELRTYRWDGSTWSLVGTGLSISGIGAPALAALNGTDVAFIDATIEELRTYRWDDSTETWSLVGTGLSISGAGVPALAALNGTDVAFIDATIEELRTYRWDDSTETWSLVGTGLSISGIGIAALAALNGTDVAFIDRVLDELRTYRFDFQIAAIMPYSVSGGAF